MGRFTLTVRIAGKVEHARFGELEDALAEFEARGHALQGRADAAVVGGSLMRRYEPQAQVTARLEIRGPRVACGVDIRGDGSAVPFTGRFRRREIERRREESSYDALRRML